MTRRREMVLRDLGLGLRDREFMKSEVREIGSNFTKFYRVKKWDRSFTSRDRELREIGVRAIESHLYVMLTQVYWY